MIIPLYLDTSKKCDINKCNVNYFQVINKLSRQSTILKSQYFNIIIEGI